MVQKAGVLNRHRIQSFPTTIRNNCFEWSTNQRIDDLVINMSSADKGVVSSGRYQRKFNEALALSEWHSTITYKEAHIRSDAKTLCEIDEKF